MRSPPAMPVVRFDSLDSFITQPIMQLKELEVDFVRWNEYQLWRRWSVWDKQNPPLPAEQRQIDTSRTADIEHP